MSALIEKIQEPNVMNRVAMALGFSDAESNEQGRREASMYITGVVSQIQASEKLQSCTAKSIAYAMIDAAKMKVTIDGQGHAALVSYKNEAKLQITSKGFEAKLHQYLENSNVTTGVVYKGDEFKISRKDGFDSYEHNPLNPFEDNVNNIQGVYVIVSYTKDGKRYQSVEVVSKKDLDNIKSTSRSANVWNKWYVERAKTAAIKRVCKRFFNEVMGLQAMVDYDNKTHHKIELDSRSDNNLIENLNSSISKKDEAEEEVEVIDNEVDDANIIEAEVIDVEEVKEVKEVEAVVVETNENEEIL